MSIGINRSLPRSARRVLAAAALLGAAAPISAQVCAAARLKPPVVRVAVSIEACDYLAAIAEKRHPRECRARLTSVQNDAASRVHVLERMLADSLAGVFAENFGFLRWRASGPADRWTLQVRLQQPAGSGRPPMVQLRVIEGDSVRVASDPTGLESIDKVDAVFDEQAEQGAGSLERTNARWTSELRALISAFDGAVRTRWIRTALKQIPVMSGVLKPERDGPFVFARLPIRDSDIRAEPNNRPHFQWQVTEMRTLLTTGATPDTTRDPGLFGIAECQAIGSGYNCKLTDLQYGSARFATAEQTATFMSSKTPTFVAPMSLHVTDYSPARRPCTGGMPQ